MYIIYRITNNINKKCYIGYTTKSAERRFQAHCSSPPRTHFHNAIKKYGKKNFTLEILCRGEDEKAGLNIAEPLLIAHFKPEYNLTPGGDNPPSNKGKKHKPRTIYKITRAAIRRWYKSKPPKHTTVYMA